MLNQKRMLIIDGDTVLLQQSIKENYLESIKQENNGKPFIILNEDINSDHIREIQEEHKIIFFFNTNEEKKQILLKNLIKQLGLLPGYQIVFKSQKKLDELFYSCNFKILSTDPFLFVETNFKQSPQNIVDSLIFYNLYKVDADLLLKRQDQMNRKGIKWSQFSINTLSHKLRIMEGIEKGDYTMEELKFVAIYFEDKRMQEIIENNTIYDSFPFVFILCDIRGKFLNKKIDVVHVAPIHYFDKIRVHQLKSQQAVIDNFLKQIDLIEKERGKKVEIINKLRRFKIYTMRKGMEQFFNPIFQDQGFKDNLNSVGFDFNIVVARSFSIPFTNLDQVY